MPFAPTLPGAYVPLCPHCGKGEGPWDIAVEIALDDRSVRVGTRHGLCQQIEWATAVPIPPSIPTSRFSDFALAVKKRFKAECEKTEAKQREKRTVVHLGRPRRKP